MLTYIDCLTEWNCIDYPIGDNNYKNNGHRDLALFLFLLRCSYNAFVGQHIILYSYNSCVNTRYARLSDITLIPVLRYACGSIYRPLMAQTEQYNLTYKR